MHSPRPNPPQPNPLSHHPTNTPPGGRGHVHHRLPVLARILTESKLILSTAGVMTMGAAALNDAIAWCLLGA